MSFKLKDEKKCDQRCVIIERQILITALFYLLNMNASFQQNCGQQSIYYAWCCFCTSGRLHIFKVRVDLSSSTTTECCTCLIVWGSKAGNGGGFPHMHHPQQEPKTHSNIQCYHAEPIETNLTPMLAMSLVRLAMPPGRSLTVQTNRTSRPSTARPRSKHRPSTVVSMLPPHSGITTLKYIIIG